MCLWVSCTCVPCSVLLPCVGVSTGVGVPPPPSHPALSVNARCRQNRYLPTAHLGRYGTGQSRRDKYPRAPCPQGPPAHKRTHPAASGQRPAASVQHPALASDQWQAHLARTVAAPVDASQDEVRDETLIDPWGLGRDARPSAGGMGKYRT